MGVKPYGAGGGPGREPAGRGGGWGVGNERSEKTQGVNDFITIRSQLVSILGT